MAVLAICHHASAWVAWAGQGDRMVSKAETFVLEIGDFPTHRLAFASTTQYQDGTLLIDREALLMAIAAPQVLATAT